MVRKILLIAIVTGLAACGDGRVGERSDRRVDDRSAAPAVLFLGTSLTAGRGLEPEQAYPALIQQKMDSAGLRFRAVNAGESGGTSAGGVRRIQWLLRQPVAVLVLELGANDGLRGLSVDALRDNLQEIIDQTKAVHPDARVVVAGMEAPPNMGDEFTERFREVFADVARENGAVLIPFLLEGVAGVPELNQEDGIHPTAEGQRIMAAHVWTVLYPILQQISKEGQ